MSKFNIESDRYKHRTGAVHSIQVSVLTSYTSSQENLFQNKLLLLRLKTVKGPSVQTPPAATEDLWPMKDLFQSHIYIQIHLNPAPPLSLFLLYLTWVNKISLDAAQDGDPASLSVSQSGMGKLYVAR